MRISFVINDLSGGGAEKALLLLANFLANRGHEVLLVRLSDGNDSYSIDNRIETTVLGGQSGSLASFVRMPILARNLGELLRRWRPDISVSFLPRSNLVNVLSAKHGNPAVICVTEQASTSQMYRGVSPRNLAMKALIRRFYRKSSYVVSASRGVAEGLAKFGVQKHKSHVVYNSIDIDGIRILADSDIAVANGIPTVVTVGRLAPQKDHATLVRAFQTVRESLDSRLLIVGEGPLRKQTNAIVRELGLQECVSMVGWQENPFATMASADLFVLSSSFEGFGNVLVEAMACGLPVISTNCPSGPSEILENGIYGQLVPVGEPDLMANAILNTLTNPTKLEHFRVQARQRAIDFDISKIGVTYESLLEHFIAHKEQT